MYKRYLKSDFSEYEKTFFFRGQGIYGESNFLTLLYRLIGRYSVLRENGKSHEIANYFPEDDHRFKYENIGIGVIKRRLALYPTCLDIPKKYFVYLERKWRYASVNVTFDVHIIFKEAFAYIASSPELAEAAKALVNRHSRYISEMIPIQHEFISARHVDGGVIRNTQETSLRN